MLEGKRAGHVDRRSESTTLYLQGLSPAEIDENVAAGRQDQQMIRKESPNYFPILPPVSIPSFWALYQSLPGTAKLKRAFPRALRGIETRIRRRVDKAFAECWLP